jgi:hypothetical protein
VTGSPAVVTKTRVSVPRAAVTVIPADGSTPPAALPGGAQSRKTSSWNHCHSRGMPSSRVTVGA